MEIHHCWGKEGMHLKIEACNGGLRNRGTQEVELDLHGVKDRFRQSVVGSLADGDQGLEGKEQQRHQSEGLRLHNTQDSCPHKSPKM